ncbi:MAG: sigma-54 dependent transcriptional regulator [Desulfomonilia bacterium]|jgi:transcriptional regulator with GAF, ATPase, and Fis domain
MRERINLIDKKAIDAFTQRVFSSRDLESSINEVYKFLRKHFPLDFMNIPIYDSQRGTLWYRSFVTDDGVILADETIRLSEIAQAEALKMVLHKTILISNVQEHPITREVGAHLGIEDVGSTIILNMGLGPERYGVLGLVAFGKDRYTGVHLKLLEDLFEPVAGAVRYILSQLEIASLRERLIIENQEIRDRLAYRIIGAEAGLKEVMSLVDQAAPLDVPVLLMGETGTGKEVIANAIHHRSSRSDGPLISVNCGAIPETLLDSELFGYEKGAFTGAVSLKKGYFEQADRGTIFLDEIGELSLQAQVKLLRVIQTLAFQRVGGSRTISIDVRVITATNRDLATMVENRQFRSDLWFRLNIFPIRIPPLRERKVDIPALAEYFARRQSIEMNLPYTYRFLPGAIEQLQRYDWPGNVRELQNVIERALIISGGEPLSFPNLSGGPNTQPDKDFLTQTEHHLTLDEMIDQYIRKTLTLTNGRIAGKGGAADLLALNPSTLRGKMRKLGIQIKRVPGKG